MTFPYIYRVFTDDGNFKDYPADDFNSRSILGRIVHIKLIRTVPAPPLFLSRNVLGNTRKPRIPVRRRKAT